MQWFLDHFNVVFGHGSSSTSNLTAIAVGVGMVIAFTAAIFAYLQNWFETPFSWFAAFLYGSRSIALFSSCSCRSPASTGSPLRSGRFLHAADLVP